MELLAFIAGAGAADIVPPAVVAVVVIWLVILTRD